MSNIKVYGWYDAGYDNIHEHKMILAAGENKEAALRSALIKSKLLEIYKFESFDISDLLESYRSDKAESIKRK